jgi:hypothetical protein
MARRSSRSTESFALALRDLADVDVPGGTMTISPQEWMSIQASRRADSAGTPLGMLTPAARYQDRVTRLWDFYGSDPLFRKMIDRVTEFSVSGSTWEVGRPAAVTGDVSETVKTETELEGRTRESDQQDEFWNVWAAQVNRRVPNVLPTLEEVQRWATKHMQVSGMFVMYYKLGKVKVGRREYIAPTEISCFPASSVVLQRKTAAFMEEQLWVAVPKYAQDLKNAQQGGPAPQIGMLEGDPRTASHTGMMASNYMQLPQMDLSDVPDKNPLQMVGKTEAYCLKYNWTPGDLVTVGRPGSYGQTGASIYPLVPHFPLTPQFLLRQKLFASDLAILDGILQYIMWFKVGNKDRPAKAGDVEKVRALIEPQLYGPARQFYLPDWVSIEIMMPKADTLLSEGKYFQSTMEIMQAFGLLSIRTSGSSRERMERMNIAGFEEMCGSYQQHWRLCMDQLAWRIRRLNHEKLTRQPRWVPEPLNTADADFRKSLLELVKYGKLSGQTLLRMFQLNDKDELERIIGEQARHVTDVWEENTPIAYRQVATPANGQPTSTGIPGSLQRGRPTKGSPRQPKPPPPPEGEKVPPKAPTGGGERLKR